MIISQHALMRVLQREYDEYIINDSTFHTWKRTNPDGVPKAEREIMKLFNESNYTIECPDVKGSIKKFKINTSKMWIMVHDDNTIITIYPIVYSEEMNSETNKKIFDLVYEEYSKKLGSFNAKIETSKPVIETLNKKIEECEEELKRLKSKVEYVESVIKSAKTERELELKGIDIVKKELNAIALKTVQPISFI